MAVPICVSFVSAGSVNASASELSAQVADGATLSGDSGDPSWLHAINDISLDEFIKVAEQYNPNHENRKIIVDGVDYGTDGCSAGGQAAFEACWRHDANIRSLQEHPGFYNQFNWDHVAQVQFGRDLQTLVDGGVIGGVRRTVYLRGTWFAGHWLPANLPEPFYLAPYHSGPQHYVGLDVAKAPEARVANAHVADAPLERRQSKQTQFYGQAEDGSWHRVMVGSSTDGYGHVVGYGFDRNGVWQALKDPEGDLSDEQRAKEAADKQRAEQQERQRQEERSSPLRRTS
ncbi:hypothetical protein [Streptomyces sp. NPDC007205]|uniref:hypothetical protein n=1 Tax=Streptomyces sp. NPDC007205 TaxID=3154316 RepID=UPI0033FC536F